MHNDQVASEGQGADLIIAAAQARGVPSSPRARRWSGCRDATPRASTDVTWAGGRLGFTVVAGAGTTGLQGMVPLEGATGPLLGVSSNGVDVPVTTRTIKGVAYSFFPAVLRALRGAVPGHAGWQRSRA